MLMQPRGSLMCSLIMVCLLWDLDGGQYAKTWKLAAKCSILLSPERSLMLVSSCVAVSRQMNTYPDVAVDKIPSHQPI